MDPQLFRRPSNETFQPHENQTSGNSIIQNPRFVIAKIIQTKFFFLFSLFFFLNKRFYSSCTYVFARQFISSLCLCFIQMYQQQPSAPVTKKEITTIISYIIRRDVGI